MKIVSLMLALLVAWSAGAVTLEAALDDLFATNLLLTVAGLKPMSQLVRAESSESLRTVIAALQTGELQSPELEARFGWEDGYDTHEPRLDEGGRVVEIRPAYVPPSLVLNVLNRAALERRLRHPVVRELLLEENLPSGGSVLIERIWRNDPISTILAGIGYGFPVRDVRTYRDEERGIVDYETMEPPPLGAFVPAPSHRRPDRRRSFVTMADGSTEVFSAITYGTQSKSAWGRIRREVRRIEAVREAARRHGISNVRLFNAWSTVTCGLALGEI